MMYVVPARQCGLWSGYDAISVFWSDLPAAVLETPSLPSPLAGPSSSPSYATREAKKMPRPVSGQSLGRHSA